MPEDIGDCFRYLADSDPFTRIKIDVAKHSTGVLVVGTQAAVMLSMCRNSRFVLPIAQMNVGQVVDCIFV